MDGVGAFLGWSALVLAVEVVVVVVVTAVSTRVGDVADTGTLSKWEVRLWLP